MKKNLKPLIITFVLLIILVVINLIFPGALNFLDRIPDINIEIGNMNINTGDIDLGKLAIENGVPKYLFSPWAIACIVCFVLFTILSLINNKISTILSLLSWAFPILLVEKICRMFNETIATGGTTEEASSTLTVQLIILGLVTFAAPVIAFAQYKFEPRSLLKDKEAISSLEFLLTILVSIIGLVVCIGILLILQQLCMSHRLWPYYIDDYVVFWYIISVCGGGVFFGLFSNIPIPTRNYIKK